MGSAIILLVIAAVLSAAGKFVYDWRKKASEKKEIKGALISELIETKINLALNAYFVDRKYGTYDRDVLLSIREHIDKMKDAKSKKLLTEYLSMVAKGSDEKIESRAKIYSQYSIRERGIGLTFKTFELPYLSSQFEKISLFGTDMKRRLFEINKEVGSLNQEIDNSKNFMDLTYTLEAENHQINLVNLEDSNKQVGKIAKKIVGLIDLVLPKLAD